MQVAAGRPAARARPFRQWPRASGATEARALSRSRSLARKSSTAAAATTTKAEWHTNRTGAARSLSLSGGTRRLRAREQAAAAALACCPRQPPRKPTGAQARASDIIQPDYRRRVRSRARSRVRPPLAFRRALAPLRPSTRTRSHSRQKSINGRPGRLRNSRHCERQRARANFRPARDQANRWTSFQLSSGDGSLRASVAVWARPSRRLELGRSERASESN